MVADGVGDGVGLALGAGEVAADDALQFGEFADHAGDEVGLGEARGAFGFVGEDFGGDAAVAFDDALLDQPARQLGDALDLVGDGAELFVEDDLLELLRLLLERDLEVLLPEEARVAQPRGEHALVARDDRRAAVVGVDVGGADEVRRELARAVAHDEIFLVDARGELDHFLGHVEEIGVERAEQRHRPFGQPGILDHQPLVLDQQEAGILGGLDRARRGRSPRARPGRRARGRRAISRHSRARRRW